MSYKNYFSRKYFSYDKNYIIFRNIFKSILFKKLYICHMCHLGRVRDSEPRLQINSMSGKDTASSRLLVPFSHYPLHSFLEGRRAILALQLLMKGKKKVIKILLCLFMFLLN